ncbi:MAG TPA: response regulator [Candidatus Angelobacter sp.]|nr:response regulator [Candidatus Angelobacter sp.]
MSLRILFADDSMTAQNMGKKILSEAGYDVVAVSNGAAAVKKIAEQKPDIIILDVYMPGYSGLEVCEKVRGSLDTLKTPVLLTVGKMEPFKSEDGNRVKADGVIIKPFEATDLLAIVKKLEERIGNTPPPLMVAQTVVADPVEETAAVQPEPAVEQHSTGNRASVQPMVEVPDHMASSAAFGDMLGSEPANSTSHFAVNTPAATFETSVIVPAPPVPTEHEVPSPALEAPEPPVAVSEQVIPEEVSAPIETVPDFISAPVEEIPAPALIEPDTQPTMVPAPAPVAEAAHPQFIPVFKDPEPQREPEAEYAFMPTSVAPIGDLEIPREPALQETAEETTRSTEVTQVEPGLMSTIGQQVEAFPAQALEAAVPPPPPIETSAATASAPQASYSAPAPMPVSEAATEVTDADFEARVAAAMAAYNQASEPAHNPASATESKPPSAAELGQVIADHAQAIAVPEVPEVHAIEPQPEEPPAVSEQVPSFEYQPPVRATEPAPIANAATANAGSAYEHIAPRIEAPAPPSPSPVPMSVDPTVVAASVEAAMPEAAASVAAEAGDHHHTIAAAVHRVMERLKPELVEEIMKELRSKK